MSGTGRFGSGQFLTTGEKAFVVMVAAGFFGYWAGFNLSVPGVTMGVPVAAAVASMPATLEPSKEASAGHAGRAEAPKRSAAR